MSQTIAKAMPALPWTRETLEASRKEIAAAHREGATGLEIVRALADLADTILLALYEEASATQSAGGVCLVALGGYGRRELAPYSDIDLMFLYSPECAVKAKAVSTLVLHALWDLGFQVGHSLRSIDDCLSMSKADLIVRDRKSVV